MLYVVPSTIGHVRASDRADGPEGTRSGVALALYAL